MDGSGIVGSRSGEQAPGALADRVPSTTPAEHHRPHAGMLRFPDVSGDAHCLRLRERSLVGAPRGWIGHADRVPAGAGIAPKFSPDGNKIAFVGNYEGNRDLYVVSTDGGVATRVTYHPAVETLCDWTPDGRLILFHKRFRGIAASDAALHRFSRRWTADEVARALRGANGTISHDGRTRSPTRRTASTFAPGSDIEAACKPTSGCSISRRAPQSKSQIGRGSTACRCGTEISCTTCRTRRPTIDSTSGRMTRNPASASR